MNRPAAGAWALVLGAGSLVLLLVLALLVWLAELTPEGRALLRDVDRARLPSTTRRAAEPIDRSGDEAPTALTVEVFDREGAPVAGLALQVRRCDTEEPWQDLLTDARGHAQVALDACAALRVEDAAWHLLGPTVVPLGPARVRARVEVAHTCAGPVEVTLAGAPFEGRAYLFPGGFGPLDADGAIDLTGRLCGPADAWVIGPGAPEARRMWELRGLHVEEDEPLRIELEGVAPRPPTEPRTVQVHFEGGDLPDQVRAHVPCVGEGADWTCTCDTRSACPVAAWWQEALYDWRFVKEEVARVPPGQTEVSIDLDRAPADLRATWTGPQPCSARAVDEAHGAEVSGACLPDGTTWFGSLREGTWRVELAWNGGDDASTIRAVREVEMDGEDQDLGRVGPD